MGVTEQDVIEALRPVVDPELGVSIVELDMVRGVRIHRGEVAVTVALTVAGCPLRAEITRRVTDALTPLRGVKAVSVDLTVMTPQELDALRAKFQARSGGPVHGQTGQRPLGHEDGRPNPFMDPTSSTRVIGITSGKGGVGKSSVTVNLAVALAKAGYAVGVLDADVYGFSVPRMLGIDAEPTVRNEKMVPPVAFGVHCISIGFFVGEDQPVMWRGPMLHKALEQFLVDVDWASPDFLLIDMPPGTGDVALSMAQYLPSSEVYVVTTPQPAARRVAQRSAYMAKKINLPLRGVIENMSWFTGDDGRRYELFGRGGGEQLAAELHVPLLGQIPLVPALREGGDRGQPVTVTEAGSEVSKAFDVLAESITALGRSRIFRSELAVH